MSCYLAIDRLLHSQIRISGPDNKAYRDWLRRLNETLEKELKLAFEHEGIEPVMKQRVAHYSLCLVQLYAYLEHTAIDDPLSKFVTSMKDKLYDVRNTSELYEEIILQDFGIGIVNLEVAQKIEQLDVEVTHRIALNILLDGSLKFDGINSAWLLDLSLMCKLEELPASALRLLCFAVSKGWVKSNKIRTKVTAIHGGTDLIERLALHEEFTRIAIGTWQHAIQAQIDDGKLSIELPLYIFQSRNGRRVISAFTNDTVEIKVQMISILNMESNPIEMLKYATGNLSINLLTHTKQGESVAFNLGKIISHLGAQEIYDFITKENSDGLPIHDGNDKQKMTISKLIAERLNTEFGVSVAADTLSKAYAEAKKGTFKDRQQAWKLYQYKCEDADTAALPWYFLQCHDVERF
jgi:hypothetical protein